MKKVLFSCQIILLISCQLHAQNVGIGTPTPNANALLHVDLGPSTSKGLLVTGTYNAASTVPNLGAGSRLMYYTGKAAFRAGYVNASQWDNANVGVGSSAFGSNTFASGIASTAMGDNTTASGMSSTAMGSQTAAGGLFSTAMGSQTAAVGDNSTAMGYLTTASGAFSTAMGRNTTASGSSSTALGSKVSTFNQTGAFVIGDSDPSNQGFAGAGLPDLFVARFFNGYYLYTSGVGSNFGVAMNHNGNAWISACDKNRKENFEQLNGEDVLQKISKIKFSSWNYKQQDPNIYRHYGIMAQDFYNAFGHDKYGTIGNDTTVNPIDMIGIDMTAIQALEKRTATLKAENTELKNEVSVLISRLEKIEKMMMNK